MLLLRHEQIRRKKTLTVHQAPDLRVVAMHLERGSPADYGQMISTLDALTAGERYFSFFTPLLT